jgi:hypothetical protein
MLHYAVENTHVTLHDLRALGFAEHIVAAINAITKRAGEPLAESMNRVVADSLALIAKRAGISHNADPVRQADLTDETRVRLTEKYERSALLLGTNLLLILAKHEARSTKHEALSEECGIRARPKSCRPAPVRLPAQNRAILRGFSTWCLAEIG